MKTLDEIRQQLATGEFEFSRHAHLRAISRNISTAEIMDAGRAANLIEEYPNDKYSPSGLLLGFTAGGRPLHFQVSFAESEKTKIITLYEPNPNEWINFSQRR